MRGTEGRRKSSEETEMGRAKMGVTGIEKKRKGERKKESARERTREPARARVRKTVCERMHAHVLEHRFTPILSWREKHWGKID